MGTWVYVAVFLTAYQTVRSLMPPRFSAGVFPSNSLFTRSAISEFYLGGISTVYGLARVIGNLVDIYMIGPRNADSYVRRGLTDKWLSFDLYK